ncbi:MAG: response regulator transcription factor [Verrucomicrobia bacterium]|nr:response regulator transcription factor [Verrucomicrobiota bacterium]
MKRTRTNSPGAYQRIRTVVIDDSPEFLRAVEHLLRQMPSVELIGTAEDGAYALTLMASERPDLVLMDVKMPWLNGLQATQRIRAWFPGVRVILITLHEFEKWNAASVAAGADCYLSKSCLREELPGVIARLFPVHPVGTVLQDGANASVEGTAYGTSP